KGKAAGTFSGACRGWAWRGVLRNTDKRGLLPAADELQHDFAPVWPGAMLGNVDALPSPERERPANHGDVERYAGEHGLYVRRHVVRPLDIMNPLGIGGGDALERAPAGGADVGGSGFLR